MAVRTYPLEGVSSLTIADAHSLFAKNTVVLSTDQRGSGSAVEYALEISIKTFVRSALATS